MEDQVEDQNDAGNSRSGMHGQTQAEHRQGRQSRLLEDIQLNGPERNRIQKPELEGDETAWGWGEEHRAEQVNQVRMDQSRTRVSRAALDQLHDLGRDLRPGSGADSGWLSAGIGLAAGAAIGLAGLHLIRGGLRGGVHRQAFQTRDRQGRSGEQLEQFPRRVRRRGWVGNEVHVRESIIVNKMPDEVYRFWRDLENLGRFMQHLKSVKALDERRSHWKATASAGRTVEWDAEITEDQPDSKIGWRSVGSRDVEHTGSVAFEPAPGNRGTYVRVDIHYRPPAGALGTLIAKLFGEEPSQQIYDDLRRFKQLIETGEIAQSDASIHGGMHPARPSEEPRRRRRWNIVGPAGASVRM